ncbi:hypothetical protein F3J27_03570 [Enterobacter sp. Ap-916]|uniref:anti-RecBCD protein 2 n=1 Tax=Enterobacteriaceae TaxID=543 RepID=UPI000272B2E4|nr:MULTISPECIES: anti-RecBCD protein 2 [unclassified Enterobacter]EJF31741.1 anti-RecBCD protein 2 [Enterobacter sp. Ag1]NIF57494.1 hypothetical protein [Enterobacter sp. Ap-867]NIG28564.1 hypothetical protein [Enterobacter sp. Ap-916]
MPSPQPGADNPRLCTAKTKEEVMANFARYWGMSQAGEIEPETKQQRMERQANALADALRHRDNFKTSFYPEWETIGPHLPYEYTDDRSRVRFGRYGARISD